MSDLFKYKQVNWIDGMKINKDHFIEMENHFTARINDISNNFLNTNNYGLLPHKGDPDKFLSISKTIDNQNYLNVKVDSCFAVTPGGFRIDISKKEPEQGDFTIQNVESKYEIASDKDDTLFVILSIDPFTRIPVGKADSSEYPLRLPFVNPEYKLHLIPAEQLSGDKLGEAYLKLQLTLITFLDNILPTR